MGDAKEAIISLIYILEKADHHKQLDRTTNAKGRGIHHASAYSSMQKIQEA